MGRPGIWLEIQSRVAWNFLGGGGGGAIDSATAYAAGWQQGLK